MSPGINHHTQHNNPDHSGHAPTPPIVPGFVSMRTALTRTAVASGPRCVQTNGGELICSFMVQAALGLNDFCPLLIPSSDNGQTWTGERPIWPHLQEQFSIFGSVSRSL